MKKDDFKPGDKVRILSQAWPELTNTIGEVGIPLHDPLVTVISKTNAGVRIEHFMYPNSLEKIENKESAEVQYRVSSPVTNSIDFEEYQKAEEKANQIARNYPTRIVTIHKVETQLVYEVQAEPQLIILQKILQ